MAKQNLIDLVATLDAETAKFDQKVNKIRKELKDLGVESKKSEDANKDLGSSFEDMADKVSALPGPLGEATGQVSDMVGTVAALGPVWGVVGTAITATLGALTMGMPILAETERRLLQQEQLIKATGYSSGYTAKQLDEMARAVAMSTLTSTEEAAKAIGVMLTFRGVMGSTFKDAIMLSQDIASVWGTDMSGAAETLGEALNDPAEGLSILGSFGVTFTEQQKAMVEQMVATGDTAKAQAFILDELRARFGGGAAAEAGGLIGAVDTMTQTWGELLETMADKSGTMFVAKTTLEGMINIAKDLKGLIDPEPMVEFHELMQERVKLEQELRDMGPVDELPSINPFGNSKNEWFNTQRRLGEIFERMKQLQEEYKQEAMAQTEAQEKARIAAAEREKQRLADEKARKDQDAKEEAERQAKILSDKEQREAEAAARDRLRDQEQTDAWLTELERRNMSEMELINAKYMDDAMKLAAKKQQDLITEEAYQQALLEIKQTYAQQRLDLIQKETEDQEEATQGFWAKYYESMQATVDGTDELWRQTFDNFTTGFGNAFADAIMQSESFEDAFKNMAKGMAQSMLAALGKIMAQRMVMWALEKTLLKGETAGQVAQVTAEAQSASILSGIHAFSSTAAIPIVGPLMAPGAMASALAITQPMAAAATAASAAGFAGAFDNGGYIPAGQWGITGEYGPEITLGPSHIVGRKQTMSMLQQATQGGSGERGDIYIEVNNVPEGYGATATQRNTDDGREVIAIMLQDLRNNGEFTSAFQQRHGLKRQGN